jgi:PAS domain S-box-containing protein
LLGYGRQDLAAGRITWQQITSPEFQALDSELAMQLTVDGKISPHEKEFSRKDGTIVPVLIGCTLLESSQDQGVAFVLDLTERRLAEVERSARRVAEAANRAKSEFLALR